MQNEIVTHALYWEKHGNIPSFISIPIQYENDDLIVKVRTAMFGKALHRAITIGHPKIQPPKVLGTLLSGDIVIENPFFPVGTRIVINPHSVSESGSKVSLYPGAMSQFVKIKGPIENAVYPIPDKVDYDSAVYCELIACALEAVAKIRESANIVIIGCGLMALIQLQIAKYWGVENVICIYNHHERKGLIEKYGGIPVEYNDNFGKLKSEICLLCVSDGDIAVIDSAGTKKSIEALFKLAEPNSKVILFAGYPIGTTFPIEANDAHYHNYQIMGSYHFEEKRFTEALNLLEQGVIDIKSLITGKVNWSSFETILMNFQQSNNISNIVTFD